jgi:UDP-GlcNAc:undecaprenyl-phosphate GlcNAc-1-phosphate transferase
VTIWSTSFAFLMALAVSALATPIVARLAISLGAVDRPDERKVNRRPNIPLLGGISVALGFFVGLAAAMLLSPEETGFRSHMEGLFLGGLVVLSLGALDDRWGLGAFPKLTAQILAAGIAIAFGFQIDHLTDPISRQVWHFPTWLIWVLTTLWIVVVTNSINLMDGLDGLASGIAAIIAVTLTFIAWQGNHVLGVVVGVALVGALLGFLPYNFPPARIFVGDTGALFIGYSLSLLALEGYQRVTPLTFIVPLLALAVPLIDTLLSILRRLRRRTNIMKADRLHIHHHLLESAGSHRSAVLSLYFLTACFCIIAVSFTRLEGYAAVLFLAAVGLLTLRLLRNLGFFDVGEREESAPEASAEVEGETR